MTVEERLKQLIGQLVFENAALACELERLRDSQPKPVIGAPTQEPHREE